MSQSALFSATLPPFPPTETLPPLSGSGPPVASVFRFFPSVDARGIGLVMVPHVLLHRIEQIDPGEATDILRMHDDDARSGAVFRGACTSQSSSFHCHGRLGVGGRCRLERVGFGKS